MISVHMFDRGDGVRLAVHHQPGAGPTLLFLPGYMSNMTGTKATMLMDWAIANGRACLLMDYSGCGRSAGLFDDGSIRRWAADARAVADHFAPGPLLLIGSSMGGWIMLHLALALGSRIVGMLGIAAAPDFTRWGLALSAADIERLAHAGFTERPSGYADTPYRYSRTFISDAETACLLGDPIAIQAPARLLHGMADDAVPSAISIRLAEQLMSPDVQVVLIKGGDHRLSAPAELALLLHHVQELSCA